MYRKLYLCPGLILFLIQLFFGAASVHATITVQDYWRMGENDATHQVGRTPTTTANSITGSPRLNCTGGPIYSADTAGAAAQTASFVCLSFSNTAYASCPSISSAIDNFGLECWVKPTDVTNGQTIVYNGDTGFDGWGLTLANSNYSGLFGSVTGFGAAPAVPNVWTHLAIVCTNGVTTLYVNGIAAGTTTATPYSAEGENFAVAANPQNAAFGLFAGLVDEVRFFTFAPGQFSTNDLLYYQQSPYRVGNTNLTLSRSGQSINIQLATITASTSAVPWQASTSGSWLRLTPTSGTGNQSIRLAYQSNTGPIRSGTLTIAGQTIAVAQASFDYAPVSEQYTLVSNVVTTPMAVALDGAGNGYFADFSDSFIGEWIQTNNTVVTLVSSNLAHPEGLCVDGSGNVYISDSFNNAVKKWSPATSNLTTLVSTGLNEPAGIAVDYFGNVYIADSGNNAIKEWVAASNQVVTLPITGLFFPCGVAVDTLGNVFIADTYNGALKEWSANNGGVTTLISGLSYPFNLAVDGSGDVFVADPGAGLIYEWALNGGITTVAPDAIDPYGAAVDGDGDIFVADAGVPAIEEIRNAFVYQGPQLVDSTAGNNTLPPVLPIDGNFLPPFAPSSDQLWLTINSMTNGAINFTYTTGDSFTNRTGNITVLGQLIAIIQNAVTALGTENLLEPPAFGVDSVVLSTATNISWIASSDSLWLHPATQSGTGSTNVLFTFDANTGSPRTGTITVCNQPLTVTQAGSSYVAVSQPSTLPFTAGSSPMTVDQAGDVYFADTVSSVSEWVEDGDVVTLITNGLGHVQGLAVDSSENLYISDAGNVSNPITLKEWSPVTGNLTTLVSSGIKQAGDIAVDPAGNVYLVDPGSGIKEWLVASNTLVSIGPNGGGRTITVDRAGNAYFTGTASLSELPAGSPPALSLTALSANALHIAVDGSGNVYIDLPGGIIQKWSAATGSLTGISTLGAAMGPLAVDGFGNLYFDDNKAGMQLLPYAFVDSAPKLEGTAASYDTLSSLVALDPDLPYLFTPTSSASWLTVNFITDNNGVEFSFTANSGTARAAYINLLNVMVPVYQAGSIFALPPLLTNEKKLANGTFQFNFISTPGASFSVLASTNLTLPLNQWPVIGIVTNSGGSDYQFTTPGNTNASLMFYRVRSP